MANDDLYAVRHTSRIPDHDHCLPNEHGIAPCFTPPFKDNVAIAYETRQAGEPEPKVLRRNNHDLVPLADCTIPQLGRNPAPRPFEF